MKKFIAIIALMISVAASAESVLIYDETISRDEEVYSIDFEVNKDMNRAWVNVVTSTWRGDSSDYSDNRRKVEGLSYDPELNGVVYDLNGEQVVCGTFYNARWVIDRGMSFRKTGRCTFTKKLVKEVVDNGFETYKVSKLHVYLNVE